MDGKESSFERTMGGIPMPEVSNPCCPSGQEIWFYPWNLVYCRSVNPH